MNMEQIKILMVASKGGHWCQLMQLKGVLDRYEVTFACTDYSVFERWFVKDKLVLNDFNRNEISGLFSSFIKLVHFFIKERPRVVISTGAAPGLLAIIIGRVFGAKTIWIDSIANTEKLSLSGHFASFFSNYTLTQWAELQSDKVLFRGKLI